MFTLRSETTPTKMNGKMDTVTVFTCTVFAAAVNLRPKCFMARTLVFYSTLLIKETHCLGCILTIADDNSTGGYKDWREQS